MDAVSWSMRRSALPTTTLQALEGCRVSLSLRNGMRLDDGQLVSAGRHGGTRQLWLFINGCDTFVALDDVIDAWEGR